MPVSSHTPEHECVSGSVLTLQLEKPCVPPGQTENLWSTPAPALAQQWPKGTMDTRHMGDLRKRQVEGRKPPQRVTCCVPSTPMAF